MEIHFVFDKLENNIKTVTENIKICHIQYIYLSGILLLNCYVIPFYFEFYHIYDFLIVIIILI